MSEKSYRYFDTGDAAVDRLLEQLDHMSNPYVADEPKLVDDWLIGFIERWKALPPEYQKVIRNDAYMGDLHFRMSKDRLRSKFEQLQFQLDEDIEKVIADDALAGRSNVHYHGSKRELKYGDRKDKPLNPVKRDYETSGEIVERLSRELGQLDSLFYETAEREKLMKELRIRAEGHPDISFEVSKLQKLISKKRIADLNEAKSDAFGILTRIRGFAQHWHRRPRY